MVTMATDVNVSINNLSFSQLQIVIKKFANIILPEGVRLGLPPRFNVTIVTPG